MKRRIMSYRGTPAWCGALLFFAAAAVILPGRQWAVSSPAAGPSEAKAAAKATPAAPSEQLKTLTWTETETIVYSKRPFPKGVERAGPEQEARVTRNAYEAPGLHREEIGIKYRRMTTDGRMSRSMLHVYDYAKGKMLDLSDSEEKTFPAAKPERKTATVQYFEPEPEKAYLLNRPWILEEVRRVVASPATKSLGKKTIDGKTVTAYRIEERRGWGWMPNEKTGGSDEVKATGTWEIWLETETHRVVSARYTVVPDGDYFDTHIVAYKDFVYNAPLDDSLFSMEPKGYTLVPSRGFMASFGGGGEGRTPDPPPWPPARWKKEYGDRMEVFIEPK